MTIQVQTLCYGESPSQCGELYMPSSRFGSKIVCLLHGGFWQYPYDKSQMDQLAFAIAEKGYAVWNVEYRRVGEENGGWPYTFDDCLAAINHIREFRAKPDEEVTLIGHSAGGHLALWASTQLNQLDVNVVQTIGLAPVVDLISAYQCNLGNGAVEQLLVTTPDLDISRYKTMSPFYALPSLTIPQIVIHGDRDEYVDITESRRYIDKARNINADLLYYEVQNGRHMDFLSPSSDSARILFQILEPNCSMD